MNESNENFSLFEDEPVADVSYESEQPPAPQEDTLEEQIEEEIPDYALSERFKILKKLPMLLSFLLPFLITSIAFTFSMLFTDGKNMLLSSDGWHQYYPFLITLREKLLSGGSMEYSWIVGMGGNFLSLFAYYLASPMYLLSVLIPIDLLPNYFTLMTIVKISLAGFFMGWFLRLVYRRNDMAIPIFGLMYAFCAWAAGYYWNIMWLDTFALLPLLIAATVCLLRDGKFRLYIFALALSLWSNYYIAFFCCIFVLLCFIGYCICCRNGFKNFLRRFLRIGICTLLGAGIAAVLLIPTLLAMQTTYSSNASDFPFFSLNIAEAGYGGLSSYKTVWNLFKGQTFKELFSATRQVLVGLMPATTPTNLEGLPNIFCSLSAVMLGIYYFCCKKISKREKIFNLCLLAFLVLSFIIRIFDYIWHGFHFPNMIPYRFSFLFSFVLIAMAYRAYTFIDELKLWHLCIIAPITAALVANAFLLGEMGTVQLPITLAVFFGVLICLAMYYFFSKSKKPKKASAFINWKLKKIAPMIALCIIITLEMVLSFAGGINVIGFTSQYNDDGSVVYPRKNENVQALLDYLDTKEDDPLFYRTEVTNTQTLNDPALNNYNGVSIFNSSTNANFNRLTRSLGLSSWVGSNRFVYYESSPFTNTLCGIKYLIDRSQSHYNTDYNVLLASSDSVNLLENTAFISVGFMTKRTLADFVAVEAAYNPLNEQEEMFRLATGVQEPLYEHLTAEEFEKPFGGTVKPSGTSGTQYSYTTITSGSKRQDVGIVFTVEEDGLYLATTKRPTDADSKMKVYCNDKHLFSVDIKVRALFSIGNFKKGDRIKFVYSVPTDNSGTISLDFAKQNNSVFEAGLATLSDEPFVLTEFSDGYLKGTIDVLSDGLFYTSVPYEPGWVAYVDGKEVPLAEGYDVKNAAVALTDAVISFPLSAGTHEIELCYKAPGLRLGAILSALSLLGFAALCFFLRKDPVLFPDLPFTAEERPDKKCLSLWGIAALIASVLTADLLWTLVSGAYRGYPYVWENPVGLFDRLASVLKKFDDDAIFLTLLVAALCALPFVIGIWRKFFRQVALLRKAKQPAPAEETEQTEENGGETLGQVCSSQEDPSEQELAD